jgi:peptidoglycan/LPS O-acetylase OafA/YrhL
MARDRATLAGMKEIRALTSLRGVAAVWVFLFHLDLARPLFPPVLHQWLAIGRGYIAVDLFFVLSGFVLALTYRGPFLSRPFMSAYPDFLLRRVARVMPLNAAIVGLLAVTAWFGPSSVGDSFAAARNPWTVIANILLIQDWGLAPSIDKPSWSVSVEMAVYLAYPLLLALAWSRRFWIILLLAGMASLYWLVRTELGVVSQGLLIGDFTRGFADFSFGLLCFRAFESGAVPSVVGRFDLVIVSAFWAAVVFSPTDLLPILVCPAVILSLAMERGPVAWLLGLRPLNYLGRISYSIYLVHYCVLCGLSLLPIRASGLYGAAALSLTLAISAVTFRWVERPARRWIARIVPTPH